MGEIKLGEENKQIEWKNNDEIGQLVQRYNEMLKEIEGNAKKMASSEREGAWREMAKQVAHEIKNPLTPMKLQVQMLQKSWREKDPRLDEKFERVCALLLERMDAMAEMAIQFSSFSKMPKTEIKAVLLSDVLKDMVDLQTGDDYFTIEVNEFEPFIVEVDKEQLSRVFTNLIQNARQAIPEGEKGKLSINVVESENQLICSFADNGSGVSSENAENIFAPNFSTKNSGMGMGLAICKKIIESFNGSMSFISIENKGATFYVVLPLVKDSFA
jgi:nitrogen fixation/metabolism regulation signal transduction histidine kinase